MAHEHGPLGGDTEFAMGAGGLLLPRKVSIMYPHRVWMGGVFHAKHIRNGKVIDEFDFPNIVVNEGLNYVLGSALTGATPITTWYLAPFEGNYVPVATDTAASIVANSTENTTYTSATRVTWTGVTTAQTSTNSASVATFTFNNATTKTIYGAFMASSSAKSSTSGKLLAAAQFSSPKTVENTDQILLTYTFTASSV